MCWKREKRKNNNVHRLSLVLWIVAFVSINLLGSSTDTVQVLGYNGGKEIDISEQVKVYIDSSGHGILSGISEEKYIPSKEAFAQINPHLLTNYTFFFKVILENTSSDSLNLVLRVPWAEMVIIQIDGEKRYGGELSKPDRRDYRFMPNSFHVLLPPMGQKIIEGQLEYAFERKSDFYKAFTLQEEVYAKSDFVSDHSTEIQYKFVLFSTGFLFSVIFVFVFMFLHYVQIRDKLYLKYSLYLLTVIVYSFINFESTVNINMHLPWTFNRLYFLKHPLGIFINGAYFYFISDFLDLKKKMPRVHRIMNTLVNGLYVYVIIGLIIGPVMGKYFFERQIYYTIRFLWFVPSIVFLIAIWRKQIKYGRIVLVGTLILILGSLISLVLSVTLNIVDTFWKLPILYTQIAILIEIAFFSLGVAAKIRDHEKERMKGKETLIQQLQKNAVLQAKVNQQLKDKVHWQEALSEKQSLELDKEKAISESNELQRQLAQMELLALRSQMNPHFIFNSLNSIKSYILRNGPLEASEYLTKFSNLIRAILQNSKKAEISLKAEIDTLLLYVKLEQMRFSEKFQFTYFQKSQAMLDSIMVPPLILQPYVENAIWHGLLHLDTKGILKIEIVEKGNGCLAVIIEDNGIGRKRAQELKAKSLKNYQSMGMGITRSRIELHNQINAKGIKVTVTDVFDDRESTGTRVEIIVKCPLLEKR